MNETPALIQRSILSASALVEEVLRNYDLSTNISCYFWNHSINDTYLVKDSRTKYILRVSPADWRTVEQINAEIELLEHLLAHKFPAPQAIAGKHGSHILAINAPEGIRYAVLFSFVPGAPPELTEESSRRYGRALAEFHSQTDDFPPDRAGFHFDASSMVDEPLARIKPLFSEHSDDYDHLLEISARLKQAAEGLPRTAPEYGICHGDVNATNFHLDTSGWSLIDFEYFGYGWRIFDIATFFNNTYIERGINDDTKKVLDAFLAGYQEIRPLSKSELETLPSFVLMRQIWLLGTSARYIPKSTVTMPQHEQWMFQHVMPFIRSWKT